MGVRARLASWRRWAFWKMSELELAWSNAGDRVPWRRRYLASMGVSFRDTVWIGPHFYLRTPGNLELGANVGIGGFCRIWNYAPIQIGDDFLAAGGLTINNGGHVPETLEPFAKPVRIGARVWCGVNVTILAGVTIGDDVVVGAGSVVVHDVPSNSIVGGVPARKLRDLDRSAAGSLWRWTADPHRLDASRSESP